MGTNAVGEVDGEEWRPTDDEDSEHDPQNFNGFAFSLDRVFLIAFRKENPGNLEGSLVLLNQIPKGWSLRHCRTCVLHR